MKETGYLNREILCNVNFNSKTQNEIKSSHIIISIEKTLISLTVSKIKISKITLLYFGVLESIKDYSCHNG